VRKAILIILLFPPLANAYTFGENWTKEDTAYQAAFVTLATVDWMQTRWMVKHDWQWDGKGYCELNPFLGSHPSEGKINTMIPLGIITHTLIAIALPPKARRIWQGLFIIGEIGAIGNNASAGVKLDF
jgi:hypothetical protein